MCWSVSCRVRGLGAGCLVLTGDILDYLIIHHYLTIVLCSDKMVELGVEVNDMVIMVNPSVVPTKLKYKQARQPTMLQC